MSKTYSIACRSCQKHLWCAQSTDDQGYCYGGATYLTALYDFLTEHAGHQLVYGNNSEGEIARMEEVMPASSRETGTRPAAQDTECPECAGSGLSPARPEETCRVCFGRKSVSQTLRRAFVKLAVKFPARAQQSMPAR